MFGLIGYGKMFEFYLIVIGSHWRILNRELKWSDWNFEEVTLAAVGKIGYSGNRQEWNQEDHVGDYCNSPGKK